MATPEPRFDAPPTVSNHFAWINTQLALQRTLMAATRTAVALIGFGFTVAQFFQKVREGVPAELQVMRAEAPRNFGLALIAAGILSLAVFTWQYHVAAKLLSTGDYKPLVGKVGRPLVAPVYIVAVVVLLIGVTAFITIYLRL